MTDHLLQIIEEKERLAAEVRKAVEKEIDNQMIWDIMKIDRESWIEVKIPWHTGSDGTTSWNEICAWALGEFGLPGERYVTHPTPDEMTYLFRDEKDAVLMILKWT